MDGTILNQGTFVGTGLAINIPLVCGIDWMKVYNYTEAAGANNGHGFEWYYQYGMAAGTGLVWYHPAADQTVAVNATAFGFVPYNSSLNPNGPVIATTATTAVAAPVVSTANTAGLVANQTIIRLSNIAAAPTITGIDFTVQAVNPGVSFTLPILANAIAAGGAGFYRIIAYDPIFYPRNRTVCNVTVGAVPTVTTTVNHGYQIGQQVRFVVPPANGMVELNGQQATVLSTPTANTFTISISTAGFTPFAWPLIAAMPTTYANVVPFGGDTATSLTQIPPLSSLQDATVNTAALGMILLPDQATFKGPAGSNGDVCYWVAGKSFNGQ